MDLSITSLLFNFSVGVQTTFIVLEVLIVLWTVWLVFKESSVSYIHMTESEKEDLINEFKPESLVEDVENTHRALNPRIVCGKVGLYINVDGITCINFSSHDYLGFIGNVQLEETAIRCIETYGVGSCGPRGFYGTTVEHLELEKSLAQFLETEDSLVYSNGFATLASAIPAYAKKADIIFVDENRNFAIQKGLDASRSKVMYFKHNDTNDLEDILKKVKLKDLQDTRKARRSRRYLIVEGIYINSGDICPLPGIVKLCKKYKVRILLDESVSFGVLGKTGRGVVEYFGIPRQDIDLIMGSLEYALGSVGGFCAGPRLLIDHQQITGQGYCFSASLPPVHAAAAAGALDLIQATPGMLVKLNESCRIMHHQLNGSLIINNYFSVSGDQDSPIHVLALTEESRQVPDSVIDSILDSCLKSHVAVTRPAFQQTDAAMAAVGASIRVTTSVFHTEEHITYLVQAMEDACRYVFFQYHNNL